MSDTTIQVLNNGPLRISGTFEISDGSGAKFGLAGRSVISLCRCGQSQKKPFCDGAHNMAAFKASDPARELPPPKT